MIIPRADWAQQLVPLPAPPAPKLEPYIEPRFSKGRSPSENAMVREKINSRLAELRGRLKQRDQEQVLRLSQPNSDESLARPGSPDRQELVQEIEEWSRVATRFDIETQCNAQDLTQDVELYDGSLGPSREFVALHQAATGQIQWNASFALGQGADEGNVAGSRWCTGTLISANYFLTAGHCFKPIASGWITPSRVLNGKRVPLTPAELAPLMHINFNYQLSRETRDVRLPKVFPIVKLLERPDELDYALVQIGPDSNGKLPDAYFYVQPIDTSLNALSSAKVLTIVQHPDGRPKVVGAGVRLSISGDRIYYSDIDTLGGSSGSGIISQDGQLVGVHTNGGCTIGGGANFGLTLNAISKVSAVIH